MAFQQLDVYTKIAALSAVVGLLVLGVSPLFNWINLPIVGGVIGLKGDGKIVLAITLVAIAISIAAIIKPKWLKPGLLTVQAWGTVAVFWMAALIWQVGTIGDSLDVKDNPFAGLLATMISPGAGLYLGLIGAIVVAAALGFMAVRLARDLASDCPTSSRKVFPLLWAFCWPFSWVRPARQSARTAEPKAPGFSRIFSGAMEAAGREDVQVKWRKSHSVSDEQWNALIANYKGRKRPEYVTDTDWWEEAEDKTPAELNKLYPPLQPREWYRAEWSSGYSGSRELDISFHRQG